MAVTNRIPKSKTTAIAINDDLDNVVGTSNPLPVIDLFEQAIRDGVSFQLDTSGTLTNGEEFDVGFTTPTLPVRVALIFTVSVTTTTTLQFFEDSTFTGGTPAQAHNFDRAKSDNSGLTIVADPIVTDAGTVIADPVLTGGGSQNALGAPGGGAQVLKPSALYILRFTSGGNGNSVNTHITWSERG